MINGIRCVAVICARGGSKGLPGKNIRPFAGRPMIAWTVAAALASELLDRVVVSTDDAAIADAARAAGGDVPFLRPPELATDDASIVDAVLHALDTLGEPAGYAVMLQATSPLRSAADIDACIRLCGSRGAPSASTLCEAPKSPYWMFHLNADGAVQPVVPITDITQQRQQLPQAWVANGGVFVAEREWLRRERTFWKPGITLGCPMPFERSIDIDTEWDFRFGELLAATQ
jgi:CMP-N-acetylneuraminic acid synthetase